MNIISEGKKVFDIEIEALTKTRDSLDESFTAILDRLTSCEGKVIVTGVGKPGHVATKIAATLSSLGTPAFYLHPGEAMHGDLGMITAKDVVLAISYSGESDEIIRIIPNIKLIGAFLIGITGNPDSTLAKSSDLVQVFPEFDEACRLGLAPTSSTTAELVFGDALAVVASAVYDFRAEDYGKFHPAGALGKKILFRVEDLMATGDDNATINVNATLKDAIIEMSKKRLGAVAVINDNGNLEGFISDGDVRRQLEKTVDVYNISVRDVMTCDPYVVQKGSMAVDALRFMKDKNVACLPVLDANKLVGIIRWQQIIGVGIVG